MIPNRFAIGTFLTALLPAVVEAQQKPPFAGSAHSATSVVRQNVRAGAGETAAFRVSPSNPPRLIASSGAFPGITSASDGPEARTADRRTGWIGLDSQRDSLARGSTPLMVGAGLGGAVSGFFGGMLVGWSLGGGGEICGDDPCGLYTGILGSLVGEAIGLPLGVHLANRRRGSFPLDLLTSLASVAAGVTVMAGIDPDYGGTVALAATPIVQLVATIAVERATGRRS
jgi:hypothetical protein